MPFFPLPGWLGAISPHWGVAGLRGGSDLMAPAGTSVVAIQGGTATSSWDKLGGNTVLINGADGLTYYYAHLLNPANVNGQVAAGAQIGQVDSTGDAAGGPSHLHIGIGHGISTSNTKQADSGLGIGFDAVGMLQSLYAGARTNGTADTTSGQPLSAGDSSSGGVGPISSAKPFGGVPFPLLILAALIVGAGIWYADTVDSRAGWALAILVVLTVAFGYEKFGSELSALLTGAPSALGGSGADSSSGSPVNPGNAISVT